MLCLIKGRLSIALEMHTALASWVAGVTAILPWRQDDLFHASQASSRAMDAWQNALALVTCL
jgi:hypothetical protein